MVPICVGIPRRIASDSETQQHGRTVIFDCDSGPQIRSPPRMSGAICGDLIQFSTTGRGSRVRVEVEIEHGAQ